MIDNILEKTQIFSGEDYILENYENIFQNVMHGISKSRKIRSHQIADFDQKDSFEI